METTSSKKSNEEIKDEIIELLETVGINIDEKLKDKITEKYIKDHYSKYHKPILLNDDAIMMLDRFRTLMLSDNMSDKEAIDLACNTFISLFINNNPYAYKDLESLINIKEQNPDFGIRILTDIDRYYGLTDNTFSPQNNHIYLKSPYNEDSFNHELTHAIHFNYNDFEEPDSFKKYRRIDDKTKAKMILYCQDIMKKSDNYKIKDNNEEERNILNELDNTSLKNYTQEFMEKYLKILYIKYKDGNISKEQYNSLLENPLVTTNDFKKVMHKSIRKQILPTVNAKKFTIDNSGEIALEDMFNALLYGTLKDHLPSNNLLAGRNSNYYIENEKRRFCEIIANYGAIIKSPKKDQLLPVLTDVMGKEFVNELDTFYNQMYVKNTRQNKQTPKHK